MTLITAKHLNFVVSQKVATGTYVAEPGSGFLSGAGADFSFLICLHPVPLMKLLRPMAITFESRSDPKGFENPHSLLRGETKMSAAFVAYDVCRL